jgi:hypothetical protein
MDPDPDPYLPLTNGSGSRSSKNMWIRWIRILIWIHNTARYTILYGFGSGESPSLPTLGLRRVLFCIEKCKLFQAGFCFRSSKSLLWMLHYSCIVNGFRTLRNCCFRGHDVCGRDTDVLLPDSEGKRTRWPVLILYSNDK